MCTDDTLNSENFISRSRDTFRMPATSTFLRRRQLVERYVAMIHVRPCPCTLKTALYSNSLGILTFLE